VIERVPSKHKVSKKLPKKRESKSNENLRLEAGIGKGEG
jgi:hypothetical protein